MDDAKVGSDFWTNSTAVFFLAGVELFAFGWWYLNWQSALLAVLCLLCSHLSYRGAIGSAVRRGNVVKSCFDAFRLDLLKKLGYELPTSLVEEREIWRKLNATYLELEDPEVRYASPTEPKKA